MDMQKRRVSKYQKYIPEIRKLRPLPWDKVIALLGLKPEEYGAVRSMMHRQDKKDLERFCGGKNED